MSAYETAIKVRFGDIDHAGIVFYPRISEYLHVAFEEFFADRVRLPYHELFDIRRLGLPTVRSEIDFRESLRFGDVAHVEFGVLSVGRSSATTRYRIRKEPGGPVCVEAVVTVVCVDMETFRPVGMPEDLRAVLLAHRVEA
jgi:4-hydroxybenzoyl-CoA thioesterase